MADNERKLQWFIFGNEDPELRDITRRPPPPPWRDFNNDKRHAGYEFQIDDREKAVINAALFLRRPLLVTGPPGTGKSSLAYAVANQLKLGEVLVWPITSRATLKDALYRYDAVGRLQQAGLHRHQHDDDVKTPTIDSFVSLGPLGTALADSTKDSPRVLLIDEIDKSDIDLPNDLLNIFEDGQFEIPELARLAKEQETASIRKHNSQATIEISKGFVRCKDFPFVIITSNGERELPSPLLRRCLSLDIRRPNADKLQKVLETHFKKLLEDNEKVKEFLPELVKDVTEKRGGYVATDQLMNAIHLALNNVNIRDRISDKDKERLQDFILRSIDRLR